MSEPLQRGKRAFDADAVGDWDREDLDCKVARIQTNMAVASATAAITTARIDLIDDEVKLYPDPEANDALRDACVKAHAEQNKQIESDRAEIDETHEAIVINYILRHAQHGTHGSITSAGSKRRVLLFGKPYYWTWPPAVPIGALPALKYLLERHNLDWCNSVLANVYDEEASKIAPHMDATRVLTSEGRVATLSLAIRAQDRKALLPGALPPKLADLVFTEPGRGERSEMLYHGRVVEFDAFDEERRLRKHGIKKTIRPRISLTCRELA